MPFSFLEEGFKELSVSVKESKFQEKLVKELKKVFPNSIVLKNDPNYIQGFPDIMVLNGSKWAALECKRSDSETHQPLQDYYVKLLNNMSYAAFVYPENKEVVLDEIQRALGS